VSTLAVVEFVVRLAPRQSICFDAAGKTFRPHRHFDAARGGPSSWAAGAGHDAALAPPLAPSPSTARRDRLLRCCAGRPACRRPTAARLEAATFSHSHVVRRGVWRCGRQHLSLPARLRIEIALGRVPTFGSSPVAGRVRDNRRRGVHRQPVIGLPAALAGCTSVSIMSGSASVKKPPPWIGGIAQGRPHQQRHAERQQVAGPVRRRPSSIRR